MLHCTGAFLCTNRSLPQILGSSATLVKEDNFGLRKRSQINHPLSFMKDNPPLKNHA